MRVTLKNEDMVLELDPCAGGSVSSLTLRGLDILRPGPDRCGPAFDARKYGAFPMIPFVGRIHEGRFMVDGQLHELHANMPPEPHAIHGHGWQDAWKVEAQDDASATLVYEHSSDAWPWDYEARQAFRVERDTLVVDLSVTNKSSSDMPAGLGWHPYFRREAAKMSIETEDIWAPNEDTGENLPHKVSNGSDLSATKAVEALCLDTSYNVGRAPIKLDWPTHSVLLESDPVFAKATVYVPAAEDYFCAEPISHAPNAINSELSDETTGLKWLAPGETLKGTIKLKVIH